MTFECRATRQSGYSAERMFSPVRRFAAPPRLFTLISILFFIVSSIAPSFAQRRPVLRPAARDYFAGKFVLIPRDERPSSLQQPRMLARVADHDLITPPSRLLGDPEQLIAWAKSVDYSEVAGVIISADAIAGDAETAAERLGLIGWIRAQRRGLPIYCFATGSSNRLVQTVLNLTGESAPDFLLVAGVEEQNNAATALLLSRLLNRRFGFSPKIFPVYSSAEGRNAAVRGLPLLQSVGETIKAIGAFELPQSNDSARSVDALLFVHTPRTPDSDRAAFIETIAQTINKSVAVALADLSETKESKEAVIAELRRRKLLDKLIAYASSEPAAELGGSSTDAVGRAAAHTSAFLNTVRFLRDDLERVRRFDRAHFDLLFSSFLRDWAYALNVRPKLDAFIREELKADPNNLGANADRAEAFALEQIKPVAEEIFKEQFRRNIHAILLSTGERVQFEISMLQRLQVGLVTGKTSEAEIRQSVYVPQNSMPSLPQPLAGARWFLLNEDVDDRIARRFVSTDWGRLKTDLEYVEVSVKLNPEKGAPESYAISSLRKRETRRIVITAPSNQGVFYALGKLELMGVGGQLAQDFQIAESPSFPVRGVRETFNGAPWSHQDRLDVLRFLGRVRMNRYIYAPKGDALLSNTEKELARFRQIVQVAEENFVEFVYGVSPEHSIAYSSERDVAAFIGKLDAMVAVGVRSFALCFDGAPGDWRKDEDRARFNTLAAAHAHLINRVHSRLKQSQRSFDLWVVPAVNADARGNREYLKELGEAIPQEIAIVRAGVESLSPEYASEREALANRRQIILDGFPANDDKPWRLFLGSKRRTSPALNERAIGFVASPMSQARASMFPVATAAEYGWNWRDYDPQGALDRAQGLLYDDRAGRAMSVWSRVFGDHDKNVFEPLAQKQPGKVNIESMERKLVELQGALETMGVTLEQGLLRGELAQFIARTRSAIEKLKGDPNRKD